MRYSINPEDSTRMLSKEGPMVEEPSEIVGLCRFLRGVHSLEESLPDISQIAD